MGRNIRRKLKKCRVCVVRRRSSLQINNRLKISQIIGLVLRFPTVVFASLGVDDGLGGATVGMAEREDAD
jgi:hypothetical protein